MLQLWTIVVAWIIEKMVNYFSTSEKPKRAIIAIHGWTGDIHSMEPVTKSLRLPDTKWAIPQAPYISEKKGFTWFDGTAETGWKYEESFELILRLIQSFMDQGFRSKEIYLIGFSQGACLSMEFMIRQSYPLGGIIPIAGFIRYKGRFKTDATPESKSTPVLLLHGDKDDIVNPEESDAAKQLFIELGYAAHVHYFQAGHKIPLSAKDIIHQFVL